MIVDTRTTNDTRTTADPWFDEDPYDTTTNICYESVKLNDEEQEKLFFKLQNDFNSQWILRVIVKIILPIIAGLSRKLSRINFYKRMFCSSDSFNDRTIIILFTFLLIFYIVNIIN